MDEVVTEWGDVATAAKAEGTMGPAWKMFIKTKFFVAFLRSPDDDPKNFWLHMDRGAKGAATLRISELRERLDPDLGDGIITLSGTDIVCRIEDNGAIEVLLNDSPFLISKKRVEWLRSGIKMTKERIEIRQRLAAAAPAAPMPVLRIGAEPTQRVESVSGPAPAPAAAPASAASPAPAAYVAPEGGTLTQSPYFKPAAIGLGTLAMVACVAVWISMGQSSDVPAPLKEAMPALAAAKPVPSSQTAAVYASGTPTAQASVPFTPLDNSFTVNIPGMAEEVELSPDQVSRLGDTRTNQYKLEAGGLLYTMESTDFMNTPAQDRTAEMDAVQNLIIGTDGTMIRATPIGLRGATGRDVRVRLAGGGERAARFVFIGSKLCMIAVTAPNGEQSAAQIDAYINSFQLN
ncbi:hypothetical protein [Massilia sp. CF038]|uniref:hypothetical protein n=1 Tax=Massilia sp. CF038 TaxID=1881045 RepID=UPI00092014FF|nr:hypothetical protein [Massilia sp. CF038]SHH08893.1 hypothetical protein SAMN05428948_2714 [Massilia sp. CF038]